MKAGSEAAIDLAGERDWPALRALYRAAVPDAPFAEPAFAERYMRWRYLEAPGGPAEIWVARMPGPGGAGPIAAQLVLYPREMSVSGSAHPGWLIIDVMTHPDFRGRGLLRRLGAHALTRARAAGYITCGFPNHRSARGFADVGFHTWGRVPECSAVPDSSASAPSGFSRIDGPTAAARFGDRLGPQQAIEVRRSAAYWRHRFNRPGACYEIHARRDETVLVLKRYRERVLNVCDLRSASLAGARAALALAHRLSAAEGLARLTAWCGAGGLREAYEAAGFEPQPTDRTMILAGPIRSDAGVAPGPPARFHVAQADSDVF